MFPWRSWSALAVLALVGHLNLSALEFAPPLGSGFNTSVADGMTWGDFDGDGQPELLLSGAPDGTLPGGDAWGPGTALLRFAPGTPAGTAWLPPALITSQPGIFGPVATGDFNGDGRLDFAQLTINQQPPQVLLYLNQGGGFSITNIFTPLNDYPFRLRAADCDADGDLDLLVAVGANRSSAERIHVLRNDGIQGFVPRLLPLDESVVLNAVEWADFDGDGDLDVWVAGQQSADQSLYNRLWRQQPDGSWSASAKPPPVTSTETALPPRDFDGDGDPDLVVARLPHPEFSWHSRIYSPALLRNDGPAGFTRQTNHLPAQATGPMFWADADADGTTELWLSTPIDEQGNRLPARGYPVGADGARPATVTAGSRLPPLPGPNVVAVDATGDGRTDFTYSGALTDRIPTEYLTALWAGSSNNPVNPPPGAPGNLSAATGDGEVTLSWNAAADANQATGLTYHVRVGTAPGLGDIAPGHADPSTGRRLLFEPGNAGAKRSQRLRLPAGIYYWSVQAVDAGLASGPYAAEGSFTIGRSLPVPGTPQAQLALVGQANLSGTVNPGGLPARAWFELAIDQAEAPTNVVGLADLGGTHQTQVVTTLATQLALNSTYRIWLVASNALGTARSEPTFLYVFNQPPVITLTNSVASLPGEVLAIPFTVTNPDGPATNNAITVTATVQSRPPAALPVGSVRVIGDGPKWVLEVTLFPHVMGRGSVRLEARETDAPDVASAASVTVVTEQFATQPRPPSPPLFDLAVADFNLDGRLDLFDVQRGEVRWATASGDFVAGNCVRVPENLQSDPLAADFTQDGRVDVLRLADITTTLTPASVLWRNDGAGSPGNTCGFTVLGGNLPRFRDGSMVARDADNDGDADLLVAGFSEPTAVPAPTQLLVNDGAGRFAARTNVFPGLHWPLAAWGDYDGDGDADLLLAGLTNRGTAGPATWLYRNDGRLTFTPVATVVPGFWYGAADWGDFDQDGDLDLAITGLTNRGPSFNTPRLQVYRNDAGVLTLHTNFPAGRMEAKLHWADTDSDGDLDLVVGGYLEGFVAGVSLFVQSAPGQFVPAGTTASGAGPRSTVVADMDRDGDLDLVAIGNDTPFQLRLNLLNRSNAPPSAPTNLRARQVGGTVIFEWDAATDAEQSGGLTYNLRVGTTPGGQDIVSAASDPATGFRFLPGRGNADTTRRWVWRQPAVGTFHWSVQAVDHGLAGGAFAPEQRLVIADLPPEIVEARLVDVASTAAYLTGNIENHLEPAAWWFEWGTTPSLGQTTPVQSAAGSGAPTTVGATLVDLPAATAFHARLMASNRLGLAASALFTWETPAWTPFSRLQSMLPNLGPALAEWADFDGDDDLDLAVLPMHTNALPLLFHNHQGVMLQPTNFLPAWGGTGSQLRWADWDADGHMDLLAHARLRTGVTGTNALGRNRGDGSLAWTIFNDRPSPSAEGSLRFLAGADWADQDLNGTADSLEVVASTVPGLRLALGRGLHRVSLNSGGLAGTSLWWADLNGDDYLDVVGSSASLLSIWRGLPTGRFSAAPTIPGGIPIRDSFWHDWDRDGDIDAVLAPSGASVVLVRLNDGTGRFATNNALGTNTITGVLLRTADLDADGRLDFVTAESATPTRLMIWTRPDGDRFQRTDLPVVGVDSPVLTLADFDGDRRLDLLFTAQRGSPAQATNRVTALFRNNLAATNPPPTAPTNLLAVVGTNSVVLTWDPATDANQPGGLTYNVYVGTAPGRQDILAAHSNPVTGFRRQPQPGNNGLRRTRTLVNLFPGTYWWGVQAVDASFAGGTFATGTAFVIPTNQAPVVELTWMPGEPPRAASTLPGWMTLEESFDLKNWEAYQTNHFPGAGPIDLRYFPERAGGFHRARLEMR